MAYSIHPKLISELETLCAEKGMRLTEQRKKIARVLEQSPDHPDVEELHARASKLDANISLSTVYRTVRLFDEAGIVERHDFKDGRARFEAATEDHHDHLIDLKSGNVIEFRNEKIEELQVQIAKQLGYRLVDHRMELYAVPLDDLPNEDEGK